MTEALRYGTVRLSQALEKCLLKCALLQPSADLGVEVGLRAHLGEAHSVAGCASAAIDDDTPRRVAHYHNLHDLFIGTDAQHDDVARDGRIWTRILADVRAIDQRIERADVTNLHYKGLPASAMAVAIRPMNPIANCVAVVLMRQRCSD